MVTRQSKVKGLFHFVFVISVLLSGARTTVSAQSAFPSTSVLDTFNRANGGLGANWGGYSSAFSIVSNQADVVASGYDTYTFWSATSFGGDQEAYFTFSQVDADAPEQSILLKSQNSSSYGNGVIEILYDANADIVQVWTYHPTGGWVQRGANIPVVFANGDQFGARALASGSVEVYKNGALLATRSITGWALYAGGGYIGVWFADSADARFDNFGGGNVSASATNTPTQTFTSTPTFTPTNSLVPTSTFTPTNTPVPTFTNTPSFTPTNTPVPSATFTSTATFTPTNTLTPIPTSAGGIYRVAVNGVANSSCGANWTNPCDLQYALNTLASAGDELWVKQGVYTPGNGRTSTFQLKSGVALYGGFNGTETALNQRNSNPATNGTVLSGDIGTAGTIADNVYNVVTISGTLSNTFVLDGFTVTGGNSNGGVGHGGGIYIQDTSPALVNLIVTNNSASANGGGIYVVSLANVRANYSSPSLSNVIISNNTAARGGGLYTQNASPILTNVTFSGNIATGGAGGGMNNQLLDELVDEDSIPILTNVTFSGNTANGGGGLFNNNSNPILTNVTFSGNTANIRGGAILNEGASPTIRNVTFTGNTAPAGMGGTIRNIQNAIFEPSNPVIYNSILWGNGTEEITGDGTGSVTLVDSVVMGSCPSGATCTNVINANPNLSSLANNGGFTQTHALLAGSSAYNSGGVNATCASTDQRGVNRPQFGACDIGAYEYDGAALPTSTATSTNTPTFTPTSTATSTATNTPTNTPVPPTATFTSTPSATFTFTPTQTPVPPTATFTATPTETPIPPPTATFTPAFTQTFTPTNTLALPTMPSIGDWSALGSNLAGTDGAISNPTSPIVNTIVVVGTDVYVGGCFQNAGGDPTADYIAKWDGTGWSGLGSDGAATPDGALKGCLRAIAVNGTDVYVGGLPNVWIGGAPAPQAKYLAKWNGTSWASLGDDGAGGSSLNSMVTAIAVSGNDVYVGGPFTDVKNGSTTLTEADYIAKWDGVNWSALGNNGLGNGALSGGAGDRVWDILIVNSDIYVGGLFDTVYNGLNLVTEARYLAKWDGANWSGVGSNGDLPGGSLNSYVYGLASDGVNLYAAGAFENVNNYGTILTAADHIAKWDGTNWSALGSNGSGDGSLNDGTNNDSAIWIEIHGTDIYVAGGFTNVNNNGTVLTAADYIAKWDGTNWSALGSNGSGNGSLNTYVYALGLLGDKLFVGGEFTNVNNNGTVLNTADYIAAYTINETPTPVPTFTASPFPTATYTITPTETPVPPTSTNTPTETPVPPTATNTFTSTPTDTPVPPTATYTATLTPTYTPSSTATFTPTNTATFTPTNTATSTPTNTATFTPTATNTPFGATDVLYLSSSTNGTVGGISFADEDILQYNRGTNTWSMYFDGSDVGVTSDVDAFSLMSDGTILISLDTDVTVGSLGTVDDSDIIRFTPTSLGTNTAGAFTWYFDGSDVGLTTNAEDIDAIDFTPDGKLVISTLGSHSVTGVSGNDEDLLVFTATSLESTTSGTWALYFDGSDVGLNDATSEQISSIWIDPATGQIYIAVSGAFSITGVSGDGADIFICTPGTLGATTTCTYLGYWDGSLNGFSGEVIDGLDIVK
jgi:hypothetical protein